jgi:cell division protein FtsL
MKKLYYLLIAVVFFGLTTMVSCKQQEKPAEEAIEEIEEAIEEIEESIEEMEEAIEEAIEEEEGQE